MTIDLDAINDRWHELADRTEAHQHYVSLQSVMLAMDVPALVAEVQGLLAVLEEIRHLHTDSPAGVCPSCADLNAEPGGDPLVPYPCPTLRAMGVEAVRFG